jgi:PAS domain S-box-containing protein
MTELARATDRTPLDILIVDDSPEDIRTIRRQLRGGAAGRYAIREQCSPADALRVCLEDPPDCLLLDLRMPELDGLSFIDQLRRAGGIAFPIVMLTSVGEERLAVQALRSGAQDFLLKDQTPPELLRRAIDHACERFRMGLELSQANARLDEANLKLRENIERLGAIFAQNSVGIAQTDLDGRFQLANDAFCSLSGRASDDLLTLRIEDVREPGGAGRCAADLEWETRYRRPDQGLVDVHESVSLIHGAQGDPVGQVILARDITSRKRAKAAESILTSIVEASADAMIYQDLSGTVRAWNGGAEALYGYTKNEIVGRPFQIVVPADKRQEWELVCARAAMEPAPGIETIRIRKNGHRVQVAATVSSIRDESGRVVGFSLVERDISTRKQAEAALNATEARYRLLANAMPQIVYTCNSSFETDFVNQRWFDYTGEGPGSGVVFDWLERLHPEDRDSAMEAVRSALSSGGALQVEYRLRSADDEHRWHLSRAVPVKDADGQVTGWIGTATDIHDRRLAEMDLRRSEAFLRMAQKASGAVVWDLDVAQDRYTETPDFYDQFDFEPGVPVGFEDWLRRIHPGDRQRVLDVTRHVERFKDGFEVQIRVIRKNGSVRHLLGRGSAMFDQHGRPVRFTGVNVDITEMKNAEAGLRNSREHLRLALQAGELTTWEWNIALDQVSNVEELSAMLGHPEPLATLNREVFLNHVHPHDCELVRAQLAGSLEKGLPYRPIFRIVWPDGSIHWMEAYATVTRNEEDEPERMIGTLRDISERKLLEQKLADAEKFESIGILAAGLAHDFNNLLTGVIGSANLVQDMLPPDHEACSLLSNIVNSGERAATITSQMLSYAGKGMFFLERVDLATVAREAIVAVKRSLQPRSDIVLNTEPKLEVVGDARQLREAIINLLTNAIEATEGGGRVSLTLGEQEIGQSSIDQAPRMSELKPGRYARIEVQDTGKGIDPNIQKRVFEPFYSTKFAGRGLGLAAVAGIVRAHKGDVQLSSRVGEGATAVVWLPASHHFEPQRPSRQPKQAGTGQPAIVLVVDDEHLVAELARAVLHRRGYRVKVANSGQAALEVLEQREEPVSIVLLDLTMPVMSGQETLRRIRQIDRDLPVILTSGYTKDQALSQVEAREVAGFLQKPYKANVLVEQVSHVLDADSRTAS